MAEVEVLYKCFVCPKAFSSVQALRGHMNAHKGVEVGDLHVRLPKAKIEEFLAFCRKHNASSCHMVLAMIDAYVEGDKKGLIMVGSPNPAIVHLQQFFPSRPRGHGKYTFAAMAQGEGDDAEFSEISGCRFLNSHEDRAGYLGFCRKCTRWVRSEICLSCVRTGVYAKR